MIKSFTAITREIDDAEAAAAEIAAALGIKDNLLRNSLGIVSCFPEFDETGALGAICGALPFDCIGTTSCLTSAGGETDQVMFAVTVLTSDDCSFRTAAIPVVKERRQSLTEGAKALTEGPEGPPAFLFSYFPLMYKVSGDMILAAIDKGVNGIPLFGTLPTDSGDNSMAMTIHNGRAFRETAVLGAVYGEPCVSFHVASIDESKTRNQKAVITESDGNTLIGLNGRPVLEYLEEIGLSREDLATGLGVIPFVIDHRDGTKPVARSIFSLTPENHAVCGGAMPSGATLALGHVDMQDVLRTTEEALRQMDADEGVTLSYSCLGRYFCLGADNTAEAEKVCGVLGDGQHLFACSGGEICPLPDAGGKLKNFFHNFTNIFCQLS